MSNKINEFKSELKVLLEKYNVVIRAEEEVWHFEEVTNLHFDIYGEDGILIRSDVPFIKDEYTSSIDAGNIYIEGSI